MMHELELAATNEIRIKSLEQKVADLQNLAQSSQRAATEEADPNDDVLDCQPRNRRGITAQRRRELVALAERASDWIIANNIQPTELCFFRRAVEMLTDTRVDD